jgi:hypothetical protein
MSVSIGYSSGLAVRSAGTQSNAPTLTITIALAVSCTCPSSEAMGQPPWHVGGAVIGVPRSKPYSTSCADRIAAE